MFCQFFSEYSVSFLISTLKSVRGMLKVSSCSGSWFNLCRSRWQVLVFNQQGSVMAINLTMVWVMHFMFILSHGARNVHSQVWWRFCQGATQYAIIGLELVSSTPKSLDHLSYQSLKVQEKRSLLLLLPISIVILLQSLILYGTIDYHFIRASVTYLVM